MFQADKSFEVERCGQTAVRRFVCIMTQSLEGSLALVKNGSFEDARDGQIAKVREHGEDSAQIFDDCPQRRLSQSSAQIFVILIGVAAILFEAGPPAVWQPVAGSNLKAMDEVA